MEEYTFKPAAVLVPCYVGQDGVLRVILTRRSEKVQLHKKQICFPGGAVDDSDNSLWQAALRETHEEIGLKAHQIFYIAKLPILRTPTLFEITPFVGFVHSDFKLKLNADEVDHAFDAPVDHFFNPDCVRFGDLDILGKTIQSPFYTYQNYEIWGATARILKSMLDVW